MQKPAWRWRYSGFIKLDRGTCQMFWIDECPKIQKRPASTNSIISRETIIKLGGTYGALIYVQWNYKHGTPTEFEKCISKKIQLRRSTMFIA
ncbi:MAG: hypothetical protein JWQ57_5262 [Mucilaginibacter sp.]|nr:hypothetical protein [Mucilaginibacter sp.]